MAQIQLSLSEQIKYIKDLRLDDLVASFLEHVANTQYPESFPGVFFTPPNKDESFVVLAEFSVDIEKRKNKTWVPCSICRPRKGKFFRKCYLIAHLPSGELRIVGSTCCQGELDGWQEALAARGKRERETQKRAFIQKNAYKVFGLVEWANDAFEIAKNYTKHRNILSREHPDFWQSLKKSAARSSPQLVVIEPTKTRLFDEKTGEIRTQTIDREFVVARLYGQTFCDTKFSPYEKVKECLSILEEYSPDIAIEQAKLPIETTLKDYISKWRRAQRLAGDVEQELHDARTFFTDHNFEGLRKWADDPRSQVFVRPLISDNSYFFKHKITQGVVSVPKTDIDLVNLTSPPQLGG